MDLTICHGPAHILAPALCGQRETGPRTTACVAQIRGQLAPTLAYGISCPDLANTPATTFALLPPGSRLLAIIIVLTSPRTL